MTCRCQHARQLTKRCAKLDTRFMRKNSSRGHTTRCNGGTQILRVIMRSEKSLLSAGHRRSGRRAPKPLHPKPGRLLRTPKPLNPQTRSCTLARPYPKGISHADMPRDENKASLQPTAQRVSPGVSGWCGAHRVCQPSSQARSSRTAACSRAQCWTRAGQHASQGGQPLQALCQ